MSASNNSGDIMRKFAAIDFDLEDEVDTEVKLDVEPVQTYLAVMKALQIYYQHAHWISKGESFYGDHLLYSKLYESMAEQIDTLGEKIVGAFGDSAVSAKVIVNMMSEILDKTSDMSDDTLGLELATDALKLENLFLEQTRGLYSSMKEEGSLSLGWDDMLMSLANEHESNVYLIGQRTKKA